MRAVVAVAATAAVGLAGCSAGDDRAEEEAGVLAAAEAYVAAIAALDVETADAMTAPEAFTHVDSDEDTDIRQALPDAADPITDPWVSVASTGSDYEHGVVEYVVEVSYDIRGLTGGDTIELQLADGGDPGDVDDWTITEPLVVYGETYADESVREGRIGPVELDFAESHAGVAGYPAGYLLEPAEPTPGVEPLWVAVGAADAPPWDDSLPMLERTDRDR